MNRAKDEETFNKIVHLINDFKGYYERNHQVCYEIQAQEIRLGELQPLKINH